ncbi:uncharacterized protein LOC133518310 [Cydia pomonella]|uniref:uncharacterized protein LOC133518310 n=1 Tax=Cydia pomonella TaxID=82600 RepID=UPI002ADDDC7A|nr:uncharacterized protein LOC133518310 [Cydia pomonella]
MSPTPPLARSLLALAALLAAADATTNPFCDSLSRGQQTDDYEYFVLTGTGDATTKIPDKCSRPGRELVGDYISVCNTPYSKPQLRSLMLGTDITTIPFWAVYIGCSHTIPGCSRLEVQVTQYCKMVTAPTPPVGNVLG